jgi:CheY-like chemotaxis protein
MEGRANRSILVATWGGLLLILATFIISQLWHPSDQGLVSLKVDYYLADTKSLKESASLTAYLNDVGSWQPYTFQGLPLPDTRRLLLRVQGQRAFRALYLESIVQQAGILAMVQEDGQFLGLENLSFHSGQRDCLQESDYSKSWRQPLYLDIYLKQVRTVYVCVSTSRNFVTLGKGSRGGDTGGLLGYVHRAYFPKIMIGLGFLMISVLCAFGAAFGIARRQLLFLAIFFIVFGGWMIGEMRITSLFLGRDFPLRSMELLFFYAVPFTMSLSIREVFSIRWKSFFNVFIGIQILFFAGVLVLAATAGFTFEYFLRPAQLLLMSSIPIYLGLTIWENTRGHWTDRFLLITAVGTSISGTIDIMRAMGYLSSFNGSVRFFLFWMSLGLVLKSIAGSIEVIGQARASYLVNHHRSRLLSYLGHELRSPLGAILHFAEYFSGPQAEADNRQTKSVMRNKMRMAYRNLDDLLNNIFQMAGMEDSSVRLRNLFFSPRRILDEVTTLLEAEQGRLKYQLVVESEPVTENLYGPAHVIRQVTLNVLSFYRSQISVLSSPAQSRTSVFFALAVKNDFLEIRSRVQGLIPLEERLVEQLFLGMQAADPQSGQGLGLPLSRFLLKQVGGSIGITDPENQEFHISIPVKLPEDAEQTLSPWEQVKENIVESSSRETEAVPDNRSELGRGILIIDDNYSHADILARLLLGRGYQVSNCYSGAEAIEEVSQRPADFRIMLIDYHLTDMDGAQLVKKFMEVYEEHKLPLPNFVAMTGDLSVNLRRKWEELPTDGIIYKPVPFEGVVVKVREMMPDAVVEED